MARKKKYQYNENGTQDDLPVSRSQKKRDSTALQDLGAKIASLPAGDLALLPLTEDLKSAYAELTRLSGHEARRRQLQYIGRLMREAGPDADAIAEAYGLLSTRKH